VSYLNLLGRHRQRAPGRIPDADAEIEPVPTSGGGGKAEPELDRLSNILKTFNEQFGNIVWSDADRVHKLITEDIPARVAADTAYQNATKQRDKQNARIEHDKALARVMNPPHCGVA
jgi:type I restriction enzyme R subunit